MKPSLAARARQRLADAGTRLRARRRDVAPPQRNASPPRPGPSLRKRVGDLEAEVQELRRLSFRVAELTDLVQELLVPAATRDEERLRKLLEEYDAGH